MQQGSTLLSMMRTIELALHACMSPGQQAEELRSSVMVRLACRPGVMLHWLADTASFPSAAQSSAHGTSI